MVREVDVQALAAAHRDGAAIVDVREPGEYVEGHVPGAKLIPLATLPLRYTEIPKGQPVYVICASGGRSYTAAQWLTNTGFDARSVAGGTGAWVASGHPVVRGAHENAA